MCAAWCVCAHGSVCPSQSKEQLGRDARVLAPGVHWLRHAWVSLSVRRHRSISRTPSCTPVRLEASDAQRMSCRPVHGLRVPQRAHTRLHPDPHSACSVLNGRLVAVLCAWMPINVCLSYRQALGWAQARSLVPVYLYRHLQTDMHVDAYITALLCTHSCVHT